MRKIVAVLLSFLFFLFTNPIHAQNNFPEAVTSFHSDITINNDTSLSVTEKIVYETNISKHGIFRYIPIRYSRDGLNYTVKISNLSVTDETGNTYKYERSIENGNLSLKIGDPDTTFTGTKTYIISYHVSDALKRFTSQDELYWDITGEGWQVPVLNSSATIRSPHASISGHSCYSGPVGGNDQKCRLYEQSQAVTVNYPEVIEYNDNLTVAISIDQAASAIRFPTPLQSVMKTVRDNLFLTPFLIFPLLFFVLWYQKGRDSVFLSPNAFNIDPDRPQKFKGLFESLNIPLAYEPIKGLTPGETGTIIDERSDNQDVVAEIIDLARLKYLKITKNKKEYTFTRLKKDYTKLPTHQQMLMEGIFGSTDSTTLSSLKGTFYTTMDKVKNTLNSSLTTKKLFLSNPRNTRGIYITIWFILGGVLIAYAFNLLSSLLIATPFLILLIGFLFSFPFVYNMPARTAIGTNYMLQARGLKDTIRRGKWREEIKEKHLFIEEILPFAIALGVIDRLTQDMKSLGLEPPTYFAGTGIHASNFGRSLSSFQSSASSSLSYNPSSSSWSSGSGSSGGSSGGGGGGGGGGSW